MRRICLLKVLLTMVLLVFLLMGADQAREG